MLKAVGVQHILNDGPKRGQISVAVTQHVPIAVEYSTVVGTVGYFGPPAPYGAERDCDGTVPSA